MEKKIINVAAAMICDNDKFMIAQRNRNKARALKWEFIGGKLEANESFEEALIRECQEEMAIEIAVDEFLTSVINEYDDICIRLSLFKCHLVSGKPQLLEHEALAWINKEECKNYDFCQADQKLLRQMEII